MIVYDLPSRYDKCRLTGSDLKELHEFAKRIGAVNFYHNQWRPHYIIDTAELREKAAVEGAILITRKEMTQFFYRYYKPQT